LKDVDAAFRATTYRVFVTHEAPIDLRIGERSARLDALLEKHAIETWAFITAWNPGSHRIPAEENEARQAALLSLLRERGLHFFDGSGIPADSAWQAEPSVLVLGISVDDAVELGRRFDQLAIVAGQCGKAADLIYCD
jgi:hypothetical protein